MTALLEKKQSGRYNLHRLGWSEFEGLCMHIMRVALGETCTGFPAGSDGGCDGWFRGQAAGKFQTQNQLSGDFVLQCKHTSNSGKTISKSGLREEVEKVERIADKTPCHYILMTNRRVLAPAGVEIQQEFELIKDVKFCLVLSETWIEDTLDAHPRLLRLVPRLYGIGDLSQIASFTIEQQSLALLKGLASEAQTYVPTESYRLAEDALHNHHFIVLVGPPASGKTAIAANLCMVSRAQDENVRVLRIERADKFGDTWSPGDTNTIYWVDDVFGATTLDSASLREWSAELDKIETARKQGARIIFCTRDYILAAAEKKLKKPNKTDIINDARVRVDVTALSSGEKEAILYNHIKHGDISREKKAKLKEYLPMLAQIPSFSPELARRLGSHKFHQNLTYEISALRDFFEKPVEYFRDVIHGLSKPETAALSLCLSMDNAIPDPVSENALSKPALKAYAVSMPEVREALETLKGSFVRRIRRDTAQIWQFHHPSMIEALQKELANTPSQLILYLQSAQINAILRDTTTLPSDDSHLLFIPESAYIYLIARFQNVYGGESLESSHWHEEYAFVDYLARRASDALLCAIHSAHPNLLDRALDVPESHPGEESAVAAELAVRLSCIDTAGIFDEARCEIITGALAISVEATGCWGFLKITGIRDALPGFIEEFLREEITSGFESFNALYNYQVPHIADCSAADIVSIIDALETQFSFMRVGLSDTGFLSKEVQDTVDAIQSVFNRWLLGRKNLIEIMDEEEHAKEEEERCAEGKSDEYDARKYESANKPRNARFADVDE